MNPWIHQAKLKPAFVLVSHLTYMGISLQGFRTEAVEDIDTHFKVSRLKQAGKD